MSSKAVPVHSTCTKPAHGFGVRNALAAVLSQPSGGFGDCGFLILRFRLVVRRRVPQSRGGGIKDRLQKLDQTGQLRFRHVINQMVRPLPGIAHRAVPPESAVETGKTLTSCLYRPSNGGTGRAGSGAPGGRGHFIFRIPDPDCLAMTVATN